MSVIDDCWLKSTTISYMIHGSTGKWLRYHRTTSEPLDIISKVLNWCMKNRQQEAVNIHRQQEDVNICWASRRPLMFFHQAGQRQGRSKVHPSSFRTTTTHCGIWSTMAYSLACICIWGILKDTVSKHLEVWHWTASWQQQVASW